MMEEKIKAKKEFFGDEYKPSAEEQAFMDASSAKK